MGFAALDLTFNSGHEFLQGVGSGEDDVDVIRGDVEFVLAGEFEEGFQLMSQTVHGAKVEKSGAALEAVKAPKDGVECVLVLRFVLEGKDTHLDFLKVLTGFPNKFPEKIGVLSQIQRDR